MGCFQSDYLDWYRVYCYGKIFLSTCRERTELFMAYIIARLFQGQPRGQGQVL